MRPAREREFEDIVLQRLEADRPGADGRSTLVLFTLARVANLVASDVESAIWRPAGVSYAGFRVIFTIWAVGPLEPRRLAELASVTRGNISSILNTLERDGYVVRTRGSADRRLVTADVTDKARDLWARLAPQQAEREAEWLSALTRQERIQLVDLLRKLATGAPDSRSNAETVEGA
jgi:DNA-binding MarR family transcriptional regulator